MQLAENSWVIAIRPGISTLSGGALNLTDLETNDCPLPNLRITVRLFQFFTQARPRGGTDLMTQQFELSTLSTRLVDFKLHEYLARILLASSRLRH
jgi:hypothetical protein